MWKRSRCRIHLVAHSVHAEGRAALLCIFQQLAALLLFSVLCFSQWNRDCPTVIRECKGSLLPGRGQMQGEVCRLRPAAARLGANIESLFCSSTRANERAYDAWEREKGRESSYTKGADRRRVLKQLFIHDQMGNRCKCVPLFYKFMDVK